ncbi:hypothetical protein M5689_010738 [Euphorbia peplus]|nr:hypothetical protein M5689_010738 [Euphorbia peplus]
MCMSFPPLSFSPDPVLNFSSSARFPPCVIQIRCFSTSDSVRKTVCSTCTVWYWCGWTSHKRPRGCSTHFLSTSSPSVKSSSISSPDFVSGHSILACRLRAAMLLIYWDLAICIVREYDSGCVCVKGNGGCDVSAIQCATESY